MKKTTAVAAVFLAAFSQIVFVPANAQGILGSLLRGAGSNGQSTNDRQMKLDFVTEIWLEGSQWVVQSQDSRGEGYPSALACEANLRSDAHVLLSGVPIRPLEDKQLRQNVIIVKDGAEPDAPVWKLAFVTCGSLRVTQGQPLDPSAPITASGKDVTAVVTEAQEFIQQTDGSFPPPPTARDKAQQVQNQKYVFTVVDYGPDGHLLSSRSVDQFFDTAQECSRFAETRLKLTMASGGYTLRNAVLFGNGGTGSAWLGCLHPEDVSSPAAVTYFSVKMTEQRALSMGRFPSFASPASGSAQPGHKVKI